MGTVASTSQNMKVSSSFYHLKHSAFKETISSISVPNCTLFDLKNTAVGGGTKVMIPSHESIAVSVQGLPV